VKMEIRISGIGSSGLQVSKPLGLDVLFVGIVTHGYIKMIPI
jgi:hypothetical protein